MLVKIMIDQTTQQVNITVNEARVTFLRFFPAFGLLRSLKDPDLPCPFLIDSGRFQMEYANARNGRSGQFKLPWHDRYGKLFWRRYAPSPVAKSRWEALVPLCYDLTAEALTFESPGCKVVPRVHVFPWGIGIAVEILLEEKLSLNLVVDRIIQLRNKPVIHFGSKQGESITTIEGLTNELRSRVAEKIYGVGTTLEGAGEMYSIATIVDVDGVTSNDPIVTDSVVEDGPLHRALEGMTTFNEFWLKKKATGLDAARVSSREVLEGRILYGKKTGLAVWFPEAFRSVATDDPDRLSCYHRNLTVALLQTESLCQLARDAAGELRGKASLDNASYSYGRCAKLAARMLGLLHGRKADDSPVERPETYTSGCIRKHILRFKDDVNELRKGVLESKTLLDA